MAESGIVTAGVIDYSLGFEPKQPGVVLWEAHELIHPLGGVEGFSQDIFELDDPCTSVPQREFDHTGSVAGVTPAYDLGIKAPSQRPLENGIPVAYDADDGQIGIDVKKPVGQSDSVQSLIRVRRTDEGFDYEEMRPVRFVPLVEGLAPDS